MASLYPCKNSLPNRVSNFKQTEKELKVDGYDFIYGYKCSDVHNYDKLNKLSKNIFEKSFYRDQNDWQHKSIFIDFSEKNSDKVIDLVIYKIYYVPIKQIHAFSVRHDFKYIRKRSLSCYSSQIV